MVSLVNVWWCDPSFFTILVGYSWQTTNQPGRISQQESSNIPTEAMGLPRRLPYPKGDVLDVQICDSAKKTHGVLQRNLMIPMWHRKKVIWCSSQIISPEKMGECNGACHNWCSWPDACWGGVHGYDFNLRRWHQHDNTAFLSCKIVVTFQCKRTTKPIKTLEREREMKFPKSIKPVDASSMARHQLKWLLRCLWKPLRQGVVGTLARTGWLAPSEIQRGRHVQPTFQWYF